MYSNLGFAKESKPAKTPPKQLVARHQNPNNKLSPYRVVPGKRIEITLKSSGETLRGKLTDLNDTCVFVNNTPVKPADIQTLTHFALKRGEKLRYVAFQALSAAVAAAAVFGIRYAVLETIQAQHRTGLGIFYISAAVIIAIFALISLTVLIFAYLLSNKHVFSSDFWTFSIE